MGYNEDQELKNGEMEENKYKPLDQDDIDKYYSEATGTSDGYGDGGEDSSDDSVYSSEE